MKRDHPSTLASALLRFVASDNEALAGDLLEERRAGRSGRWFWGQLARAALVAAWHRRRSSPVAVRLVTAPAYDRPNRTLAPLDPATLNLSGIRVQGIGGLGLIAVVLLISFTMPAAWWLAATGLASGIVLGVFLIVRRRRVGLAGGGDDGPLTLFGSTPPQQDEQTAASEHHGLEASAVRHLRLPSAQEVLNLVGHYYPANRIPVKTQYLIEGLFDEGRI